MTFEETPEYQQCIRMRPACDRVLSSVFSVAPEQIQRFEKSSDLFVLDREFCIDMRIRLKSGSHVTGQEKALTYQFYKYRTFTIEFWQNRYTKEPGEFFKIASQFYLHGYSDKSGVNFIEWKVIDILRVVAWLKHCGTEALSRRTKPSGGSRASFLAIPYDSIPHSFILDERRLA